MSHELKKLFWLDTGGRCDAALLLDGGRDAAGELLSGCHGQVNAARKEALQDGQVVGGEGR